MKKIIILLLLTVACSPAVSPTPSPSLDDAQFLPVFSLTPGAYNPEVIQATIETTICVSGYTSGIRPPVSYTDSLKIQGIKQYGYADPSLANYEEDHLIPLEVGGDPKDPRNLWPQPRNTQPWNAGKKDVLENELKKLVCSGSLGLDEARLAIRTDWVAAYKKYVNAEGLMIQESLPPEP